MDIKAVKTKPFLDQKLGTSGLRKKVSVVRQLHYLENFVQSVFDALEGFEGKTLIIGGDGRYYNNHVLQVIIRMAVANQFGRIIVGKDGLLSTPATSHLIEKMQAFGALILSASHNPGGPDGDFGIKFNVASGAPAPQALAQKISERAGQIDRYWTVELPPVDLSEIHEEYLGSTQVCVIDPVTDYADYMREIFDFDAIRSLFKTGFRMIFDAMNAVTGPYARRIFEEMLGAPAGTVRNGTPLPDFGGLHPEPNLTYAASLVEHMFQEDAPDFAAASDGDGDRYMILGRRFFLNPSDSLAIMARYLDHIPFYRGQFYGAARSMPTSPALDAVMCERDLPLFETPTGWKFFGSLLDAHKISLCGEESFGAGSFHVREKDGLWAVLLWLNVLAVTGKTVEALARELWASYGRVYCSTQSYEGLTTKTGETLMASTRDKLASFPGKVFAGQKVLSASEFNYQDPVTGERTEKQGFIFMFEDKKRVVMRLSGTGSQGATLRVYFNSVNDRDFDLPVLEALAPLVAAVDEMVGISAQTGKTKPDIIT